MFIHSSLHESTTKVLGMPSPEMKNEFTLCCQIINYLESVAMDVATSGACVGFSFEEERVMQQSRDKYFPPFEN